jgi:hypothetical protein
MQTKRHRARWLVLAVVVLIAAHAALFTFLIWRTGVVAGMLALAGAVVFAKYLWHRRSRTPQEVAQSALSRDRGLRHGRDVPQRDRGTQEEQQMAQTQCGGRENQR